jgi:hypothetical protein
MSRLYELPAQPVWEFLLLGPEKSLAEQLWDGTVPPAPGVSGKYKLLLATCHLHLDGRTWRIDRVWPSQLCSCMLVASEPAAQRRSRARGGASLPAWGPHSHCDGNEKRAGHLASPRWISVFRVELRVALGTHLVVPPSDRDLQM